MPSSGQDVLGNAATRRMCAGAYLDRGFRDLLLRDVYNARNKRAAPSYGCDVVVVLHHAWRAWWLEFAQHCALLAVLGVALARVPLDAVIAASVLAICYLLSLLPGWAAGVTGYYMGRGQEPEIRQMRAQGRLLAAGLAVSFLVLLAAMIIGFSAGHRPVNPGLAWLARTGLAGAAAILAAWAAIMTGTAALRMIWLRQLRNRDARRQGTLGRRMRVIGDQQQHPLTVHSGFRPFIGSGENVRSWSFAQRLIAHKGLGTEPDQEYLTPPFTARDLVFRLEEMISGLRVDDHPETRLPGLDVAHHVFVEGTHAAPFHGILRSDPAGQDVKNAMTDAIAFPGNLARHYLACRVESWGGEVVTSVFARVSLQGRTLYLEFATYALLPTCIEYHIIDEPRKTGAAGLVKAMAGELLSLPGEFRAARFLATAPAQVWAALRPRKDLSYRQRANSRADIGATVSAREAAALEADQTYFQFQDILHHSKVIERRLIATVGDYLKEKGVDTSEFWARAQAILNNGVINTGGGSVTVTGSALGQQTTVNSQAPADHSPAPPQGTETPT